MSPTFRLGTALAVLLLVASVSPAQHHQSDFPPEGLRSVKSPREVAL